MIPADPRKTAFDFGPLPASSIDPVRRDYLVVVNEITAPAWMDNSSMYYRLMYQNAENPLPYRQSAWVSSPVALVTTRLRAQLSPEMVRTDRQTGADPVHPYVLRGELLEFEQIFDLPGRSRGVLRLRANLGDGNTSAERTFTIEEPAPTPDARGGVAALTRCSDELAREIVEWLVATEHDSRGDTLAKRP